MSVELKNPGCVAIHRPAGDAAAMPRTRPCPLCTINSNWGSVAATSTRPPTSARYSPMKKLLLGAVKTTGRRPSETGGRASYLLKKFDRFALRKPLVHAQDFLETPLQ